MNSDYYKRTGTHGILLPKHMTRELEVNAPIIAVSGHFRLVATSKRYKGERVLADFKNLILDAGLARMASNQPVQGYIQLGTGATAPAVGQTSLSNYSLTISAAGPSSSDSYVPGPPAYSQRVLNYRSSIGGATGTFSEIGIGWATVGSLFSRALILDGGGSPTTITVLSDEALDVFYTFRRYSMPTDTTGTYSISGSSYDWTMRAAEEEAFTASYMLSAGIVGNAGGRIYAAGSTLGAITGSPTGASNDAPSGASVAHSGSNTYCDATMVFPLSATPAGGVQAFRLGCSLNNSGLSRGGCQQRFVPAIPKTASQTLTLVTRVSVARYP